MVRPGFPLSASLALPTRTLRQEEERERDHAFPEKQAGENSEAWDPGRLLLPSPRVHRGRVHRRQVSSLSPLRRQPVRTGSGLRELRGGGDTAFAS